MAKFAQYVMTVLETAASAFPKECPTCFHSPGDSGAPNTNGSSDPWVEPTSN